MALQYRQRTASPERWQKALQRANDDDVRLYQISGTGQWIATSGSRENVAYACSLTDCECEAAMLGGDPVCKHRAMLASRLGYLDFDPEPEPPAPAATIPAMTVCTFCRGTGTAGVRNDPNYGRVWRSGPASGLYEACKCPKCNGAGEIPAPQSTKIIRLNETRRERIAA